MNFAVNAALWRLIKRDRIGSSAQTVIEYADKYLLDTYFGPKSNSIPDVLKWLWGLFIGYSLEESGIYPRYEIPRETRVGNFTISRVRSTIWFHVNQDDVVDPEMYYILYERETLGFLEFGVKEKQILFSIKILPSAPFHFRFKRTREIWPGKPGGHGR